MKMFNLDTCVWEITRKCNFNCAYCGSRAGKAENSELSHSQCIDIAQQLIDMKCRRVILIGGEVFLKDGWEKIASFLTERMTDVSIITNAWLIDENIVKKLSESKVKHVSISIDGDKKAHDKFRKKGSFDVALKSIRLLKKNKFTISVISTLNSESIETIDSLYYKLDSLKIDAWQLQLMSPFGNASEIRYLVPSIKQIYSMCEFVSQKNKISAFPLIIADNIGYHTDSEKNIRGKFNSQFTGCGAGLNVVGIDSIGNVRGCEALYDDEFIEGNLLKTSLRDIWYSEDTFLYNRNFNKELLSGKCKDCDVWYKCAAGCRSFNYFYNTDNNMYESYLCLRNI